MSIQKYYNLIKQVIAIITAFLLLISGIISGNRVETISLVNNSGTPLFSIVYSENATNEVSFATQEIWTGLNSLSETEFDIKADSIGENKAYEILVGNTNRIESIEASEELESYQYMIAVKGKKIVILGGSDYATVKAAESFISLFKYDESLKLPACFTLISTVETEYSEQLIGVTNQSASTIEVYDVNAGVLDSSSLVWSLKIPFDNIAGVKLRQHDEYGDVVLVVSSGKYASMITYPAGKTMWSTQFAASNPHSIELIPGDIIVVASSTGNALRFFDINGNPFIYTNIEYEDAHGVLWDPENQVLWALGRDMLRAFSVSKNLFGKIEVNEVEEYRSTVPTDYGHNLSPVYGDINKLWISSGSQVYQYDKTTKEFSSMFEGSDKITHSRVKAMGNFYDGSLLLTFPDGVYRSWTTATVSYYPKSGDDFYSQDVASETGAFYKARVWYNSYQ